MTATIETRRSSGGGLLLAAIIGAGILWILSAGAAGMESYTVSPHAVQKHGGAVLTAADYLNAGGAFRRDPCRDGKEMWTFRHDGKLWCAIVRGQTIVTLFETTERYIESVKRRDGCGGGLQLSVGHDLSPGMPSMAY